MLIKVFNNRIILTISILTFLSVLSGSIFQSVFLEIASASIVLLLFFLTALKKPFLATQIMLLLGTFRLSGHSAKGLLRDAASNYGGISLDGIRLIGFVMILAITIFGTTKYNKQLKNVPIIFWLFISFALTSLFWSEFPIEGLRLIFKIIYPIFVMLVIMGNVRSVNHSDHLINIIITAVGINVFFGALSLFLGKGQSGGGGYANPQRIGSILISAPPLALFLSFGVLVVSIKYFKFKKRYHFVLCALGLLQLVFTLQRMALFIFFVGITIILSMNFGLKGKFSLIFIAFIIIGSFIYSPIWMRFTKYEIKPKEWFSLLRSSPETALSTINTQGRYEIYTYAITELFAKKPFWGWGAGKGQYGIYKLNDWGMDGEHLRLIIDFGLFGWLLYMLFLVSLAIRIFKRRKYLNIEGKFISSIAIAALVQYCLAMITDNSIDYYDIFSQYIFVFVGLALIWPHNVSIIRASFNKSKI